MNISASEYGIEFVKKCFVLFQDKGCFLYLAAVCMIYLLIRKREPWKSFWGMYGAFLLLIVFNPMMWIVVDKLGLDDEYYRFFWLIPITPLVAYTGTTLVLKAQKKTLRAMIFCGTILTVVLCGQSVFSRSWDTIDNIYKIPDEVIEICEIIRVDCDKDEPVVASDFDLSVLINQYAPEMDLILSYGDIARMEELYGYGHFMDTPADRLYHVIVGQWVHDDTYLVDGLRDGNVDYVVTERGNPSRFYIQDSQCRLIAELSQYCIFRVELEN